jgi:tetratricopeptide (TPR) repeat protein
MSTDAHTNTQLIASAKQLYDRGDFEDARRAYEQVLNTQPHISPHAHPDRATTLYWYGTTLLELGDHTAAEAALVEARAIEATLRPVAHSQTARCLSALGVARLYAGDIAGAQQFTEQALAIREQALGSDHPDTIESLNNLGFIFNRRGERAHSLALHEEALARCDRTVGDTHRVTAEVCSSLSLRLGADQGRARILGERAFLISQHLFGPTHPTTAQLMNNLASLLADAGDDAAARVLLEGSLALHEERLGAQHPRLAYVLHNLAGIYKRAGEWDTARRCNERALIIRERVLGPKHPDTLKSLYTLVSFYGNQQSKGDPSVTQFSMPLYVCMTALQAAAGTLDPKNANMPGAHLDADTAAAQLHELIGQLEELHRRSPLTGEQQAALDGAALLQAQATERFDTGDYSAACGLLEQAIALIEQVHGLAHLDLVAPLKQMQQVMRALDKPTAILPLMQRIVDIHVAVLGEQHPHTRQAASDLASLVSSEYGMEVAFPLFEHNFKAIEQALGPEDPNVRTIRATVERWRERYSSTTPPDPLPLSRSTKHEAALNEQHAWIEEALQGIDDVDWHSLHHAYGPADDVPGLLRLLASDDSDVRDDTWQSLYSNIWHQGTVYQASAHAVPFLLRLLADHRTPDRDSVLDLLQSLATGNSYLAVHHCEEDSVFNWRETLAKKGKDFDVELQRELSYIRAANEAVGEGIALFLELAEDAEQDTEMRRAAIATLAVLSTHVEMIVSRLRALLEQPNAAAFRADIIRALHHHMDESPRSQRFFRALMQQEADADTASTAAIALIQRAHENSPESAVDVVLDALRRHGDERGYGYSAYYNGIAALLALGAERGRAALLRALPLLHYTDSDELHRFAETLLDLVFNDGQQPGRSRSLSWHKQTKRCTIRFYGGKNTVQPERNPATITDAQREVLAAIVAHDPLWEWDSNLLTLYGLPAEREVLRAWLED